MVVKSLPKSINDKLQLIETVLDGYIQHLEKTGASGMWLGRLKRALGSVRGLQAEFPQRNYSLLRFRNTDELPYEVDLWLKLTGKRRSTARSDWPRFKRRKDVLEKTQRLT